MRLFILFTFVTFLFCSANVLAQCSPAGEPSGSCSGGNGAATNGQNINSGETYWFAGSGTFANISLNGGTLRVCGDLTLNSISYNSGNIIIEASGVLAIEASMNLNGNTSITNFGSLSILGGVTMQNASNVIVNKLGATLNMGNFELQLNSTTSRLVNEGTANMGTLRIQSNNGGVCLGDRAVLNVSNLINNGANSIEFPTGVSGSCISFSGNAQLNQPLTNNTNVFICRSTGSTTSGGSDFGSASVFTDCSDCSATPLPVELAYFKGKRYRQTTLLSWQTLSELNNDYFEIQKSSDAINFRTISPKIPGAGTSYQIHHYQWRDNRPNQGINYYRLKQVDIAQDEKRPEIQYSKTIAINFSEANPQFDLYPSLAKDYIQLVTQHVSESSPIVITNMLGQVVERILVKEDTQQLDVREYQKGIYIVSVQLPTKRLIQRFVKL